jgi:uncharacterized protein YggE
MFKILTSMAMVLVFTLAAADPLPTKPHVYVEGSATVEVEPDEMSFSISIVQTSDKLSDAKESVDGRSRKLIGLCKELGIAAEDIATTALRISPSYKYENNQQVPDGTTVSRDVEIHLRDLSKYSDVIRAFVASDISQTIRTTMMVSDSESATDKALVEALADARQRATRLAESQGMKLGGVHSISEFMTRGDERYLLQVSREIVGSSPDSAARGFAMEAGAPPEPFEPGVMLAKAEVYVVYYLK